VKQPSSLLELLETKHPYLEISGQVIVTEFWPNKSCSWCHSLGYLGYAKKTPAPKNLTGVNALCPCGSQKKYKRCCREITARVRRAGSSIMMCKCVGRSSILKKLDADTLSRVSEELNEHRSNPGQ
jgi:hypothetical protein